MTEFSRFVEGGKVFSRVRDIKVWKGEGKLWGKGSRFARNIQNGCQSIGCEREREGEGEICVMCSTKK